MQRLCLYYLVRCRRLDRKSWLQFWQNLVLCGFKSRCTRSVGEEKWLNKEVCGNDVSVWVFRQSSTSLQLCSTNSQLTQHKQYVSTTRFVQTFSFWEVPEEPKGHAEGRDISILWPRKEQATPCLRLNEKNKASFSGFNQPSPIKTTASRAGAPRACCLWIPH